MGSRKEPVKKKLSWAVRKEKCLQTVWMIFKNTTLKLRTSMLLIQDFRKAKKKQGEADMMR